MIQYKDMNPLTEVMPGFMAGAKLAGMKPKEAPMPDIGTLEKFNPLIAWESEMKEFGQYSKDYEAQKKAVGKDGEVNMAGYRTNSELYKLAAQKNIKPDQIKNIIKLAENGQLDLSSNAIKDLFGDTGVKLLAEKQEQGKKIRIEQLKSQIDSIRGARANIGQWGHKGRTSPELVNEIRKEKDYVAELTALDPNWGAEDIASRKGGSGANERLQYLEQMRKTIDDSIGMGQGRLDLFKKIQESIMGGHGPITQSETRQFAKWIKEEQDRQKPQKELQDERNREKRLQQLIKLHGGDRQKAMAQLKSEMGMK